uniref:Uncharacterized protein n=1 Tax=Hanusia phi TaxID=3032 RepID=A0A7S0NFN8_9CRYP|mmetsp:Transcript_9775/g.22284  ORF Transcript_9775/g.22284 Transcript_9775/m.22284 type:complete len:520 (+) Transcript_9775:156-1715(+)
MKAVWFALFVLLLARPSRPSQDATPAGSALLPQDEMTAWDAALERSRQQFFKKPNQRIDIVERPATIEPILAPSAKAVAYAEQAIASDVGVEEMEAVLKEMADENKTYDYAQLKFVELLERSIFQNSLPPGRKAFNCLVKAAEIVAWRGDDDCHKKALNAIFLMEELGCWSDVTTVNALLRVIRASAVQGLCSCQDLETVVNHFTTTKYFAVSACAPYRQAEAMVGRIAFKESSAPVGAGRPAVQLDTTSINLLMEIGAHTVWHRKEDPTIVERFIHYFPKYQVKGNVETLEAICLSAFAASRSASMLVWDSERLFAMIDSWQFRMENSIYQTCATGKTSRQNFLTSNKWKSTLRPNSKCLVLLLRAMAETIEATRLASADRVKVSVQAERLINNFGVHSKVREDPQVFAAWMLIAMREAWDRGDGSTERTGGEGDEDIEKVFQIRQQAISHGLEETEEMKSLLHEAEVLLSRREQNRRARMVNEQMKRRFGQESGGVAKVLMRGILDTNDVPDLWETF